MQTSQAKSHSPNTVPTKTAEVPQKAAISAASATRVPVWTNKWNQSLLFPVPEVTARGQVAVLESPQPQEKSDTREQQTSVSPPTPSLAKETEDTQQADSVSQGIIHRLQSDPEDRAGEVKRRLTMLNPATLKIALDQVQVVVPPATFKGFTQSLSQQAAPESEVPSAQPEVIPSSLVPSASTMTPTTSATQEQKVAASQQTATEPVRSVEKMASEAHIGPAEQVSLVASTKPEAKPAPVDTSTAAPQPTERAPSEKSKATPEDKAGLAVPMMPEVELQPSGAMAGATPAIPAAGAIEQKPQAAPGDHAMPEGNVPPVSAYPATGADVTPPSAKPEVAASEPTTVLPGETADASRPTTETSMAPEGPTTETAMPETTTQAEPSAETGASAEPVAEGPATETAPPSGDVGEAGTPTEPATEAPATEQAGTTETPAPEETAPGETATATAPASSSEVSETTPTPETSAGTMESPAPETTAAGDAEAPTPASSSEVSETTTAPETSASGGETTPTSEIQTPVAETAPTPRAMEPTPLAVGGGSASAGETTAQDTSSTNELASATESAETEAAPVASSTMESGERESLLASVAQAPVGQSASGGESASAAGGSGGGMPIEEPEPPEIPDVSQAQPAQALAQVSNLPPAQLQIALKGVSAATTRSVAAQRAELAANPPQMERPSGAPLANVAEEQAKQVAQAEAISGKSTKHRATVANKETGRGKSQITSAISSTSSAPPPPVAAVPAPKVTGDAEGKVTPAEATQLKTALHSLPITDPGLEVPAEPPPQLALDGDANPSNVQSQHMQLEHDVSEAHQQGQQDVVQPMGEGHIYPDVPKETLRAQVSTGGGGAIPAVPPASGGIAAGSATIGSEDAMASIIAQEQKGAEIRAAAGQARADMVAQQQDHVEKVAKERADSQSKINEMVAQNTQEQEKQRSDAQSEVQQQREQWSDAQNKLVEQGRSDAQQKKDDALQAISQEKEKGEKEAAGHIEDGNRKADDERAKAEQQAHTERKNAEKKSEQDGGIFSWLSSKVKDFFDEVKQGIKIIFDEARKAVKGFIEAAKKLAAKAIDAARQFIVDKIRDVGNALIAIGDKVLAGFPGLCNKFRNGVKKIVSGATAVVNKLADQLKKDVQKALDILGKGLDAALGLLEKGLLAAVDGLNRVVQGAINFAKGAVEALGVFATIIKDLATHPLQWLSNLAAAVKDGIRNHLWQAFKEAVKEWFNQKLEEVLGLGMTIWNLLKSGGISLSQIGTMAWEAIKEAIPSALIQILIEKLVSMIVPAAGAIMTIIEGLQAAWGTIKRIIAAIQAFVDFLKSVKSGNTGPKFAKMLAAAAIAVIDFVANWLLKRLRKPSGGVASRIRAIAQRIGAGLKKAGKAIVAGVKKIAQVIKKAGKAAWQGIKKAGKKVLQTIKKAGKWVLKKLGKVGKKIEQGLKKVGDKIKGGIQKFKEWRKKRGGTKEERQEKAFKAVSVSLEKQFQKGISRKGLWLLLQYYKLRYGFREFKVQDEGSDLAVIGIFNPSRRLSKAEKRKLYFKQISARFPKVDRMARELQERKRTSEIWKEESYTYRGLLAEAILREREYKGEWIHKGRERGGFYPVIDFLSTSATKAISVKSIDPRLPSIQARGFFTRVSGEIAALAEAFLKEAPDAQKVLHIVIPRGVKEDIPEIATLIIELRARARQSKVWLRVTSL
jgi:hypothetical protein